MHTSFPYWRKNHAFLLNQYLKEGGFVHNLFPELAVSLPNQQVWDTLYRKLGSEVFLNCLQPENQVPVAAKFPKDTLWMQKTNMVGVNLRTINGLFGLLKYALTLPKEQDSIHLLPIWEPGVVSSLYGKVSWCINPEFYCHSISSYFPHLNNVEKQLKVVVNFLHALGKKVGMDVIPHCDRFAEMVFVAPSLFEWVERKDSEIISFGGNIHTHVEEVIWSFLKKNGSANAVPLPENKEAFFDAEFAIFKEDFRQKILFGEYHDYHGRLKRRRKLIHYLIENGYETLPMTMAPPYRALTINPNSFIVDADGIKWYDYEFLNPQAMSRVFGPLTRYRFYETEPNSWELNFDKPNSSAWQYLARHYAECQGNYRFDFMRGDMAHVQPRPDGVPKEVGTYYDPLRYVKNYIQEKGAKHFAFYAETFLAPDNFMLYGVEAEHLDAIEAEATLGDLQSTRFGSVEFREKLWKYLDLSLNYKFKPSFTILTSDKDDPRFDIFFQKGNLARYFLGMFLHSFPSYMSLGFETRGEHLERMPNEYYTKLYVFDIKDPKERDKYTKGAYKWGRNLEQFLKLQDLRKMASQILPKSTMETKDIFCTDVSKQEILIWRWTNLPYAFSVSLEEKLNTSNAKITRILGVKSVEMIYKLDDTFECKVFKVKE